MGDIDWIALCAAKSKAEDGDIYLDDAHHLALGAKFARDFNDMWDLNLPYNGAEHDMLIIELQNGELT